MRSKSSSTSTLSGIFYSTVRLFTTCTECRSETLRFVRESSIEENELISWGSRLNSTIILRSRNGHSMISSEFWTGTRMSRSVTKNSLMAWERFFHQQTQTNYSMRLTLMTANLWRWMKSGRSFKISMRPLSSIRSNRHCRVRRKASIRFSMPMTEIRMAWLTSKSSQSL